MVSGHVDLKNSHTIQVHLYKIHEMTKVWKWRTDYRQTGIMEGKEGKSISISIEVLEKQH